MNGIISDPTHPVNNSGKRKVQRFYLAGKIMKFIVKSEHFRIKCKEKGKKIGTKRPFQ